MRLLSPILRQVVYPTLSKVGYFSSRATANVLTYHGVLPQGYRVADSFLDNTLISVDAFRAQLRTLKRHYNVISPEHFLRWLQGLQDLPQRAVLLTCDDGLLNNLTVMAPVLLEEQLQCLFFVTGTSLENSPQMLWYIELYLMLMQSRGADREMSWGGIEVPVIEPAPQKELSQWLTLVTRLSAFSLAKRAEFLQEAVRWWGLPVDWKARYFDDPLLRQRFQLLQSTQVRELADAGMTIGAHTLSHPELSQQPDDLARDEIIECKYKLEICTGRAIWALAYPFGNSAAVRDREFQLAQQAGHECAFMNISGKLAAMNKFTLPRVHLTADMNLSVFEAHASGFHEGLQSKFRPHVKPAGQLQT